MEVNLTQLLELAVQQGIWAVLYIYLFFRMLKENKEREEKYQTMIDRLSGNIEDGIAKDPPEAGRHHRKRRLPTTADPSGTHNN